MCPTSVVVGTFAGDVLHAFNPARSVEDKLGETAVHVLAAQTQEVCVFVVVDGQLPPVDLPGGGVLDLHGHLAGCQLKQLLIHGQASDTQILTSTF